jgi:hypothetical protein
MGRRQRLGDVLSQVPLLAQRLRSTGSPVARGGDDRLIELFQTRLSLALRCVRVVLALDQALAEENGPVPEKALPSYVLDLGRLAAQELLTPGHETGQLTREGSYAFAYALRRNTDDLTLTVTRDTSAQELHLVATNPAFGGTRYWFVCPECHRRVLHLYQAAEEMPFGCRICTRIETAQSTKQERARRTLDIVLVA